MFIKLNLFIVICIFAFGFQTQSCRPVEDDRINRMGSDVHAELVFFFKKGTDWEKILEFHRTVIGNPSEKGTGHSLLPGIMTVARVIVNDFEGEAINFKPNATDEQKAFVKKRVVESPLIYRVYENVVPDEIKDLPGAKDIEKVNPKRTPDARPTREPIKGVITPDP